MTQQAIDPNSVIMGTGARTAKFAEINDQVHGTIMNSKVRQQTDFATNKLKFYEDGNPMLEVVITLLTDLQEDDDDDGLRAVYAKGQMLKAIRSAVVKAGAKGIGDGGQLVVRYVGDVPSQTKGMSPAKQYIAKYALPTNMTELPDQPEIDEDSLPF
jgi:hypothetical protein